MGLRDMAKDYSISSFSYHVGNIPVSESKMVFSFWYIVTLIYHVKRLELLTVISMHVVFKPVGGLAHFVISLFKPVRLWRQRYLLRVGFIYSCNLRTSNFQLRAYVSLLTSQYAG